MLFAVVDFCTNAWLLRRVRDAQPEVEYNVLRRSVQQPLGSSDHAYVFHEAICGLESAHRVGSRDVIGVP